MWFHLCNILEMTGVWRRTDECLPRVREGGERIRIKGRTEECLVVIEEFCAFFPFFFSFFYFFF